MDLAVTGFGWFLFGIAVAPALIAIAGHVWDFRLRPFAIPRAEIERLADVMIAQHGDNAEEEAFHEEDRAWRRSHTVEQGKWRRVRYALRRRRKLVESNESRTDRASFR